MDEKKRNSVRLFIVISVVVLMIDQTTKYVFSELVPLNASETVLPGFLNIVHVKNSGAAFGAFADRGNLTVRILLAAVSFFALVAIVWIVMSQELDTYGIIGFALFFGGAAGNFLDRIIHGEVMDFIDIHFKGYHWPAFNVADSALTVGAIFFCVRILFMNRKSI